MALQGSSRSRHFNFRFQPDFSIIEVVLGAFAHMDACPLLITSIVAVKPEDQGTFFQDFLGLSGYLCSIGGFYSNTALLCTRNAQNHNEAQLFINLTHCVMSLDKSTLLNIQKMTAFERPLFLCPPHANGEIDKYCRVASSHLQAAV